MISLLTRDLRIDRSAVMKDAHRRYREALSARLVSAGGFADYLRTAHALARQQREFLSRRRLVSPVPYKAAA